MALNSTYGYKFYFLYGKDAPVVLPITPPTLKTTNDSNNETISLINMGEVSIVKSPPLTTYSFSARFPMRPYPYVRTETTHNFTWYLDFFRKMKENRCHFVFGVIREGEKEYEDGTVHQVKPWSDDWETNVIVTLEKMEIKEDADNGDDVIVDFELKQYREYNLVSVKDTTPKQPDDMIEEVLTDYVIEPGDTIEKIIALTGDDWMEFYNRNKDVLNDAVQHDPYWQSLNPPQMDCMGGALLIKGTRVKLKWKPTHGELIENSTNISTSIAGMMDKLQGILTSYSAVANQYSTLTERVIKKGDTLTGIALAYYGDESKWRLIYDANPMIENKDSIGNLEGEVLIIPRPEKDESHEW